MSYDIEMGGGSYKEKRGRENMPAPRFPKEGKEKKRRIPRFATMNNGTKQGSIHPRPEKRGKKEKAVPAYSTGKRREERGGLAMIKNRLVGLRRLPGFTAERGKKGGWRS